MPAHESEDARKADPGPADCLSGPEGSDSSERDEPENWSHPAESRPRRFTRTAVVAGVAKAAIPSLVMASRAEVSAREEADLAEIADSPRWR